MPSIIIRPRSQALPARWKIEPGNEASFRLHNALQAHVKSSLASYTLGLRDQCRIDCQARPTYVFFISKV